MVLVILWIIKISICGQENMAPIWTAGFVKWKGAGDCQVFGLTTTIARMWMWMVMD